MSKQFTLGKNERLKSRKSIEQLFSEGKNFAVNSLRVYYLFLPVTTHLPTAIGTPSTLQFGVGVSAKIFKKAVDRNRIKRTTREVYRLQKTALQNKLREKKIRLNIFFIYTNKGLTSYKEVYDKMSLILNKLDDIVNEIK